MKREYPRNVWLTFTIFVRKFELSFSLQKLLPVLIHAKQKVLVKGRSILDAVRTIDDKADFTKCTHLSGFLIAIDFEKAFDTLNFNFLIRAPHKQFLHQLDY